MWIGFHYFIIIKILLPHTSLIGAYFEIKSIDESYSEALVSKKIIDEIRRGQLLDKIIGHVLIEKIDEIISPIKENLGFEREDWANSTEAISTLHHMKLKMPNQIKDFDIIGFDWLLKAKNLYQIYESHVGMYKIRIEMKPFILCELWWIWTNMKRIKKEMEEGLEIGNGETLASLTKDSEYLLEECNLFEHDDESERYKELDHILREGLRRMHLSKLDNLLGYLQSRTFPTTLADLFSDKRLIGESQLAYSMRREHIRETKAQQQLHLHREVEKSKETLIGHEVGTLLGKDVEKMEKNKEAKKSPKKTARALKKKEKEEQKKIKKETEGNFLGIREVKIKMRNLLGDKNYEKLLKEHPITMAIDIYELSDLDILYTNMLSVPQKSPEFFEQNEFEEQLSRIYLFEKAWKAIVGEYESKPKVKEVEDNWKNIIYILSTNESNVKLKNFLLSIYEKLNKKLNDFNSLFEQNKNAEKNNEQVERFRQSLPEVRSALIGEHECKISQLIAKKDENNRKSRLNTLLEEDGPRGRLVLFFGPIEMILQISKTLQDIIKIDFTDEQMENRFIKNYKEFMNSVSTWEKKKGRLWVDILVQIKKCNEIFEVLEKEKGINSNWNLYKIEVRHFLNLLTDCNEYNNWVKEAEIRYHNIMYKIRKELNTREYQKDWDLFEISKEIEQSKRLINSEMQRKELQELHGENILYLIKNEKKMKNVELVYEKKKLLDFIFHDIDPEGDNRLVNLMGRWPEQQIGRKLGQNAKGPLNFGQEFSFDFDAKVLIDKYKSFLESDPRKMMDQEFVDLDLDANIYYYKHHLIGKMLDYASSKEQSHFSDEIASLKTRLKEYLENSPFLEQDKNLFFSNLTTFFEQKIIHNKVFLQDEKWIDNAKKMEIDVKQKLITEYNANIDEARNIEEKMLTKVHEICIIKLLAYSKEFRTYFSVNNNLRLARQRLELLVREGMCYLENVFPDVFKIEMADMNYLLHLYKMYFLSSYEKNLMKNLDIYACIWFYYNVFQKKFYEKGINDFEVSDIFLDLKKELIELMEAEAKNDEQRRLCKIFEFIIRRVVNNTILKRHERWMNKIEFFFGSISIIKELQGNICEGDDKEILINMITSEKQTINVHYSTIKNLFKNKETNELLMLFSKNIENYKEKRFRLARLIGEKLFSHMQCLFPEELSFEELIMDGEIRLYLQLLANRAGTPISVESEIRLALPLLIAKLKNQQEELINEFERKGLIDSDIVKELKEENQQAIKNVYGEGKRLNNIGNVCLLYYTYKYLDLKIELYKKNLTKNENIISELMREVDQMRINMILCKTGEMKIIRSSFFEQRELLQQSHLMNFKKLLKENNIDETKLMCFHGIHHRLKRFVGEKEGKELIREYKLKYPESLTDFLPAGIELEKSRYKHAIIDLTTDERVLYLTTMNSYSLVNWADSVIVQNVKENKNFIKLFLAWKNFREEMLAEYDQLCDMSLEEFSKMEKELVYSKMRWTQLWKYILTTIDSKAKESQNKIESEFKKIIEYKKIKKSQPTHLDFEFVDLLRDFHLEYLKDLFKDDEFAEEIREGLKKRDKKNDFPMDIKLESENEKLIEDLSQLLQEEESFYLMSKIKTQNISIRNEKKKSLKQIVKEIIHHKKEEQVMEGEEASVEEASVSSKSVSFSPKHHRLVKSAENSPKNRKGKKGEQSPLSAEKSTHSGLKRSSSEHIPKKNREYHNTKRSEKLEGMLKDLALPEQFIPAEYEYVGNDEFSGDSLLAKKYIEFIIKPEKEKRPFLEISALVNEISHRLEAIANLVSKGILNLYGQRDWEKWIYARRKKWREIHTKMVKPIKEGKAFEGLKQSLHGLLLKLLHFEEDYELNEQSQNYPGEAECMYKRLIKWLHWHNLANVIIKDDLRNFFELTKKEKEGALSLLFELSKNEVEIFSNRYFIGHLNGWRKMREQIEMDEKLFGYKFLSLHNQEINEHNRIFHDSDQMSDTLTSLLISERTLTEPRSIDETVKMVEDIVHHWNEESRLLISGSYALNVHTEGSDVDCIVLVSDLPSFISEKDQKGKQKFTDDDTYYDLAEMESKKRFFGDSRTECKFNAREECADKGSLYCQLCQYPNVTFLRKIPAARVPLIEMIFNDFEFDLQFVSIPNEILKNLFKEKGEEPELEAMDELIKQFIIFVEGIAPQNAENSHIKELRKQKDAMIRSLSGYRSTKHLKDLLSDLIVKENNRFRTTILAIKHWAKRHFIYGSYFGFFNGIMLSVLVAKIYLLYPGASVSYLVEQFFLFMTIWDWPKPIQLEISQGSSLEMKFEKNDEHNVTTIDWNDINWNASQERKKRHENFNAFAGFYQQSPDQKEVARMEKHAQLIWPIISPGLPTQNAAFNVNFSTKLIMQRKIHESIEKIAEIKKIVKLKDETSDQIKIKWMHMLNSKKEFREMYLNYFLIVCDAEDEQTNLAFCDFAEKGLRQQSVYKLEAMEGIKFCHPSKFKRNIKCPKILRKELDKHIEEQNLLRSQAAITHCTLWLIGIESNGNPFAVDTSKIKAFEKSFVSAYAKANKNFGPNAQNSFIKIFTLSKETLDEWFPPKR